MYVNNGKPMEYKEEGAAIFPSPTPPMGVVPPRTMGIDMSLLTNGFVPGVAGIGADAPTTGTEPSIFATPTPWVIAAVGAVAGFLLWRHK